jgi:hypothetical protein
VRNRFPCGACRRGAKRRGWGHFARGGIVRGHTSNTRANLLVVARHGACWSRGAPSAASESVKKIENFGIVAAPSGAAFVLSGRGPPHECRSSTGLSHGRPPGAGAIRDRPGYRGPLDQGARGVGTAKLVANPPSCRDPRAEGRSTLQQRGLWRRESGRGRLDQMTDPSAPLATA